MKKETFLALVIASVLNLKEKATPEELAKIGELTEPNAKNGCILGQMFETSDTKRAYEVSDKIWEHDLLSLYGHKNKSELSINGVQTANPLLTEKYLDLVIPHKFGNAIAPFEVFICMDGANNVELVEFLQGKRAEFVPTFNELVSVE